MGSSPLPVWDILVLTIPVLAIFALGMLGLDERFVNHGSPRRRRSFCEVQGEGRFLCDPDGKPWRKYPQRQIEGQIIHSPSSACLELRFKKPRQ